MAAGRRRFGVGDERGSTSVQLVVLMPVLFAVAFTGVQAGMYYYGRTAAMAAATTAARAAATEHGTNQDCHAAATSFLTELGDVLTNPTITCTQTATTVRVTISGDTLSVIPGWIPRVEQAMNLPKERLS